MNNILDIDPIGKTITVESGVTLQQIQAATEHDLMFPLILVRVARQPQAYASTNAGGNQVIHYGVTRHLILGLTAVLPDGRIMAQDNKLLKNNAGFDLKQLMIGTEGVLGVIASVTFRLFARRDYVKTAFCAATDFDAVTDLLFFASRKLPGLSSFEVLWEDYLLEISAVTGKAEIFSSSYPFIVLLEVESARPSDEVEDTLQQALETGLIADALIAQNETQRQEFWGYRDAIAEILGDMAPNINFDIGIPITKMKSFAKMSRVI